MTPASHVDAMASFTGVLVDNGCARMKVIDAEGHLMPVLQLTLASESDLHMPLQVEQYFPAGHIDQATAAAKRYRKGQRVTVQASVLACRLTVTATHIHTEKPAEAPRAPEASPSLF